jgi:hypothetical protein
LVISVSDLTLPSARGHIGISSDWSFLISSIHVSSIMHVSSSGNGSLGSVLPSNPRVFYKRLLNTTSELQPIPDRPKQSMWGMTAAPSLLLLLSFRAGINPLMCVGVIQVAVAYSNRITIVSTGHHTILASLVESDFVSIVAPFRSQGISHA